jgi:hypothetical protein
MEFTSLLLHDATLDSVRVDWSAGVCQLVVSPVGSTAAHELSFQGMSELTLPRHQPWGSSTSINAVRQPAPDQFEVEVQSGDVIQIRAAAWSYS